MSSKLRCPVSIGLRRPAEPAKLLQKTLTPPMNKARQDETTSPRTMTP
jgi:hypothetical protein